MTKRGAAVRRAGVLLVAAAAGCRRPARPAPGPAALPAAEENHCWWAVFRTPLAPNTVAARFAGAFTALGLTNVRLLNQADTAWAHAGPTALGDGGTPVEGAVYAARVVAFRRGDSTLYRHFVGVGSPGGGATGGGAPADSAKATRQRLALCGALGRGAGVGGTAPREPDGEERRAVWRRGWAGR